MKDNYENKQMEPALVKDLPAYTDMRIVGVKCAKCQEYKALVVVEGKRIPKDCGQEDCPNKVANA
jgi:hypothetical protein